MEKDLKEYINVLVQRMTKGDDDAFVELYHSMNREIFCFLKSMWNNEELIKEAIERTFTTVVDKCESLDNFNNCYSWILTIARFQYLNKLKIERRATRDNVSLDELMESSYCDFNLPDANNMLEEMSFRMVFQSLPIVYRQIAILKLYGYTKVYKKKKIMQVSESTVKRRIKELGDILGVNLNED